MRKLFAAVAVVITLPFGAAGIASSTVADDAGNSLKVSRTVTPGNSL